MVNRWLAGDTGDFDWRPFIRHCLSLEARGTRPVGDNDLKFREAAIRRVVTRVTTCDIYASPPVTTTRQFDVVMSHYCLDAVTNNKDEWLANILNLQQLIAPGGLFLFSSLLDADHSDFGNTRYPNVRLFPDDVKQALLDTGFDPASITVSTVPADHEAREYRGVIFGAARLAG